MTEPQLARLEKQFCALKALSKIGRGGDLGLEAGSQSQYRVGWRLSKQLRHFGAVRRKALSRFGEF